MPCGVTLDCQKIQAESQEQLQKAILNTGHTDRVDHDADPKEGRKKFLTGKKVLENKCIAGKKKIILLTKKITNHQTFIYILLIYVQVWNSNL